jgi:hypothetical protein
VGKAIVNPKDIHGFAPWIDNRTMNTYDIRRKNLQLLITSEYDGVQRKLADAVDRQADYISRCLSGKKGIGENFARHIEQKCGKPV